MWLTFVAHITFLVDSDAVEYLLTPFYRSRNWGLFSQSQYKEWTQDSKSDLTDLLSRMLYSIHPSWLVVISEYNMESEHKLHPSICICGWKGAAQEVWQD